MPWFVKIETGIVDKQTFDRYVPAHLDYVQSLVDKGHKATTGYWRNSAGGMLLFEADSLAVAEDLVKQDPLIKNCCVDYDLHEWVQVNNSPKSTS
ncbi:MAG: YciI family protein [Thermosynechococcaceae cyanobacterium]